MWPSIIINRKFPNRNDPLRDITLIFSQESPGVLVPGGRLPTCREMGTALETARMFEAAWGECVVTDLTDRWVVGGHRQSRHTQRAQEPRRTDVLQ